VAVALELGEEIREHGTQQAQHGRAQAVDRAAGRAAAHRGPGVGEAERRQRRVPGRALQPDQQPLGIGVAGAAQNAPLRISTTGTVLAMIVRSSQIDQLSM
jgi:hypothetical protein